MLKKSINVAPDKSESADLAICCMNRANMGADPKIGVLQRFLYAYGGSQWCPKQREETLRLTG